MTTSILLSNEFSDEKSGGTEFSNTLNQTFKFDGGKWKVELGEFAYQPNSWDNLRNIVIELKMLDYSEPYYHENTHIYCTCWVPYYELQSSNIYEKLIYSGIRPGWNYVEGERTDFGYTQSCCTSNRITILPSL